MVARGGSSLGGGPGSSLTQQGEEGEGESRGGETEALAWFSLSVVELSVLSVVVLKSVAFSLSTTVVVVVVGGSGGAEPLSLDLSLSSFSSPDLSALTACTHTESVRSHDCHVIISGCHMMIM